MFDPITLMIFGALVAGTAIALWDDIRDKVTIWLHNRGLQKTVLMDAWVVFDKVMGRVRRRIFGKLRQQGTATISEDTLDLSQIDDEEVRRKLVSNGSVQRNVMSYIN